MTAGEAAEVAHSVTKREKRKQAARVRAMKPDATGSRYEAEALESIARSWELDDPVCADLALKDAQVWATLHLANRVSP